MRPAIGKALNWDKALRIGLRSSPSWRQMEPYLSPKSKKLLLKGLATSLTKGA